jgi:hypothetical protein
MADPQRPKAGLRLAAETDDGRLRHQRHLAREVAVGAGPVAQPADRLRDGTEPLLGQPNRAELPGQRAPGRDLVDHPAQIAVERITRGGKGLEGGSGRGGKHRVGRGRSMAVAGVNAPGFGCDQNGAHLLQLAGRARKAARHMAPVGPPDRLRTGAEQGARGIGRAQTPGQRGMRQGPVRHP